MLRRNPVVASSEKQVADGLTIDLVFHLPTRWEPKPICRFEAVMSVRTLTPGQQRGSAVPIDRRTAPRHPCLREIACQAVMTGKDERVPALLQDVSTGGLRLVLRRCYETGRVLAVSWRHPRLGPERTLLAHVVHATDAGGGNWVVGCSLETVLTEEELASLL
jgi:hypothetical protein